MRNRHLFREPDSSLKKEADKTYSEMLKKRSQVSADWGWDRLQELISPDLRKRFVKQKFLLSQAITSEDYEKIKAHSEGMMRGLDALVAYAKDQGFKELSPSVWVTNHPETNTQIFIALDAESLPRCVALADAEKPSLYFSIKELFVMIDKDTFDLKKRLGDSFGNVEILERTPIKEKDVENILCDEIL